MTTASDSAFSLNLPPLPETHRHKSVEELYEQGFIAEQREMFELAASYFEEIHHRQRDNPYVLVDLARMYTQLIEMDQAKSALREASQLGIQDAELWLQLAEVYAEARLDEEAERCFLHARNHAGGNPLMTAALIGFYERRGMLAQAQAALARVERKGTSSVLIAVLKGLVLLRSGDDTAAIELLTGSLPELPAHHPYQIAVRYALARALAGRGEEAASLEYLREAKARQERLPEVPHHREASERLLRGLSEARAALESGDIRPAWRQEAGPNRRPLVFLLGYPRSGTTLLEQIVEAHSGVHSLEETVAFSHASRKIFTQVLHPGETPWETLNGDYPGERQHVREWYFEYARRLGAPADPAILLLDKNPVLTGHVHMIARLFPDAKLLFMVRDPRDICLSAYQTHLTLTQFSVNWLRWPDTVRHCVRILEQWVAVRNRLPNPYLEVRYEDLVADLPWTGRRVMDFLGLNWEPPQENFAQHARAKQVYSPTLYEVRQGLTRQPQGKWRRFGMDYAAGGDGLKTLLEQFGYA